MHILFVGISGFPRGLANIEKVKLIGRSMLLNENTTVRVLNRKWSILLEDRIGQRGGIEDGIHYENILICKAKPKFINRNLLRIIFPFWEIKKIKDYNKVERVNYIISTSRSFSLTIFYKLASIFVGAKLLITYVEYGQSMVTKGNLSKINDYLFEYFGLSLIDGIFPISEFLISIVKKQKKNPLFVKIPTLCDFEKYDDIQTHRIDNYFLFCGAASYIEIIKFIIKAFDSINDNSYKLVLICNGNSQEIEVLKNVINKCKKKNKIELLQNLSTENLVRHYKGAKALLIPLRETLQDKARFPHKIGEYSASGRPIISTNFGEVAHYFKDGQSALLAEHYDIKLFAKKMDFVISNPQKASKIGLSGKHVAMEHFDYKIYSKLLMKFFKKIEGV